MRLTFECPVCKKNFTLCHEMLGNVKCRLCGDAPPPDIQTAYANVGKTMSELYGCCDCDGGEKWLPKELKH